MIVTRKALPRRTVLRGLGASIALPLLDGMVPAFAALRNSGVRTMTPLTTRLGTIVGKSENDIQSFQGIPYAKPPVGERRFRAPEPHGPWSGTLDATRLGNRAMQPETPVSPPSAEAFSEDCLSVDIYTPAADGRARPVLFWIHGGAYYIGSGNDHDGSVLAAQGDVVVVTVNYRLGVFGFLDLSKYDDDLAGSASNGLRDPILALTWVRDNIADYGGDPNNVTIFGVSSGGGSVNALLAAPSADGPGEYLAALQDAYPDDTGKTLTERVWTEMFRRAAIRTSEAVTAAGSSGWLYRFDLPSSVMDGALGATHGCEVPFTFNYYARPETSRIAFFHDPKDPVVRQLAEQWSNTVLAFARTGDPNGAGLPHWSPYSADRRGVLILDAASRIEQDPDSELRKRWGDA